MTMTITQAFELPRPEDLRAMGFVIKLREAEPDSDEVKQLIDGYVVTPIVAGSCPGSWTRCSRRSIAARSRGSSWMGVAAGGPTAKPLRPILDARLQPAVRIPWPEVVRSLSAAPIMGQLKGANAETGVTCRDRGDMQSVWIAELLLVRELARRPCFRHTASTSPSPVSESKREAQHAPRSVEG